MGTGAGGTSTTATGGKPGKTIPAYPVITNPTGGNNTQNTAVKAGKGIPMNPLTNAAGVPYKPVTSKQMAQTGGTAATDLYLNNSGAFVPTQGQDTTDYYGMLEQQARAGTPLTGAAQSSILGLMNGGGMGDQAQPNSNSINLQNYANGSQIGASNGLLNQVLDANSRSIADQVNLNASLGGRYGSGAYQGQLTQQLGDMRNAATLQQMNQDIQNQMAASNAISGEQQNAYQNRLGANQLGLSATQAAPDVYNFQSAPAGLLGQVGQAKDAYADAVNQAPVNALNNYLGAYGVLKPNTAGAAGTAQKSSGLQQGLGFAAGAAGLLGSIF